MEFILLFTGSRGGPEGDLNGFAAMHEFAGELASQGKLRRGAPLTPEAAGAWVRVRDGRASVTDGPFAETKEVVGGFWIIEAKDRAEAIEIARRCPHAGYGIVEVYLAPDREVFADSEEGTPFILLFRMEPGLTDPDGSKMREMISFGEGLEDQGKLLESARLERDPPPARVETRGAKVLVTDGPFAETKEAIGGYSVVRVTSRAEAIDLAKRYPHAKWGPVEVREIMFFDET